MTQLARRQARRIASRRRGALGVSSTSTEIGPLSPRIARSGRWRRRSAGGKLAEASAGDRAALDALGEGQLALGEDALGAELCLEQLRGGGAAQPVIDRAGRDDRERQAEAGVAQAGAGGAQEAGLGAEEVDTLQQPLLGTGRDAAVGGGAADAEVRHHVVDCDDAVAADEAEELAVAVGSRRGDWLRVASLNRSHGVYKTRARRFRPPVGRMVRIDRAQARSGAGWGGAWVRPPAGRRGPESDRWR